MIVVTGANGNLGRKIVEELLGRVPAEDIGVSVRDANKAQDLKERGVRVRQGNFDDSESLLHAFEQASQVLIVSSNALEGEEAVRQHQTAIDMAKKAGAGRVLYTSHMGSAATSHFPPMRTNAATEEILKSSGMAFTSLRCGFFASSALLMISDALKTGELIVPDSGPIAWTTHSDLAAVTAAILTEGKLDGITSPLTASEAIDMEGIASIVSKIMDQPIRHIVVPDEEYRKRLTSHGMPAAIINLLTGIFQASRQGDFSQIDPTLENLIGRPPIRLQDFLKDSIPQSS
ncbi:SDR family oxidoreductase [Paenibacillus pinistramenti]|uniref:SDR family oxidoreductase n=1 Tax=Paenibacillus pinistramenti TaxID=1768003 RepID=UPI001109B665|nr:SDR family oxidoreductase [Paenibacillus pinistramenti]